MNADEFVRAIEKSVRDSAVSSTISNLQKPPGRAPQPELVAISEWYMRLAEADRRMIEAIARRAANHATFGFLVVLDGDRVIEAGPEKGKLELFYVKGAERVLLNSADKTGTLHD